MRIALIILHDDPARGGAERYTTDLAAALNARGHDASIISSESLDIGGVTRVGQYIRFLDTLDRHLDREKYDIVHAMLPIRRCDFYHPHAGVAAAAAEKWNVVFNPRRRAMANVEKELLATNAKVLCLSDYVKRAIRAHYPLPDDRLVTLFNAVNLEHFAPAPPRPARDYINALFIGNDFERKGLPQAIAALLMLKENRLKLTVVGRKTRGSDFPDDARDSISFAGEAPDPRPFYRDADFLVLPTRHDPCSLVVLEALAMGVPVISTKFNGATEIMSDGVHGFVLDDPSDIDALAVAMKEMLDPDRRAAMSRACLELRPKLSYEQHLDRLCDIYQSAAARR